MRTLNLELKLQFVAGLDFDALAENMKVCAEAAAECIY